MFTQSRAAALGLIAPLMMAALSGAASADNLASGLSHPREDPYYPDKGDPRIDALHYGLELNWNRKARTLTGAATIRVPGVRMDRTRGASYTRRPRAPTISSCF